MRFILALIFAIFATQASSQTQQTPAPSASPQVTTPPAGPQVTTRPAGPQVTTPPADVQAAADSDPVSSRTRLTCSKICRSGMQGVLAGKDLDEFNACADALMCLEAFPPVTGRDFLDPFFGLDIFRSGPDVKG
jgi:hypothetical protein